MLAQVRLAEKDMGVLIHVENQAYTQSAFARLYEKYALPIYPVVIFSFDAPQRLEPQQYRVEVLNLKVLEFNFVTIHLLNYKHSN